MKVLITGATGFVGRVLVDSLIDANCDITALVRESSSILLEEVVQVAGCDLKELLLSRSSSQNKIKQILQGIDVVIHLAARVHVMEDNSADSLTEFRTINRYATLVLARLASESGVKRFVFLSSIGVNGNNNQKPFTENDSPKPHDLYAISKYEAEQGLLALAKETDMEVVIIRPPLVYSSNAPGNFNSLVKWMGRPIPLPFGAIHNQRSLVALDNLVNFISLCVDRQKSPKAANQVFLISDGEDVSTTQLLRKVAKALNHHTPSGIKAWLVPVPVSIMTFFAKLLGKGAVANRLFGSLQVDSSKARDLLGWKPVVTMDEQLCKITENEKNI
jgi:nucleoside-diphosphate-sugar epimerase